ncbi:MULTISPECIES: antifreeze protein [unclassified Roseovarius]|uniref:antifreeze protein n=1 Tax=unclassified Roseovarius TaxID=2614913 RepID=UPI00273D3B9C|nr:antifreeze protein [Roseovarius sp. MMSF_3350]
MGRTSDAMNAWSNALEAGMIMAEAYAVIAMRLWGMAGLWAVTPSENHRMMSEKAAALTRSMLDANTAAFRGGDPSRIIAAAMKPVRQKTRANARRLAKRGPKRR